MSKTAEIFYSWMWCSPTVQSCYCERPVKQNKVMVLGDPHSCLKHEGHRAEVLLIDMTSWMILCLIHALFHNFMHIITTEKIHSSQAGNGKLDQIQDNKTCT